MNRYLVTIEREVIVYAETPEEARRKASRGHTNPCDPRQSSSNVRATAVEELPALKDEKHEIIDNAPARETRR